MSNKAALLLPDTARIPDLTLERTTSVAMAVDTVLQYLPSASAAVFQLVEVVVVAAGKYM